MVLLRRFYQDEVPGPALLVLEGALVTVAGVFGAWWLFPDEASLVSLFLASISTTDSMERILLWNRRAIQEQGEPPARANLRLTVKFLAIFLGCFVTFGAFGALLPMSTAQRLFSHQLGPGVRQLFPALDFGDFGPLVSHNLYVTLFFFAIALPFRQGGVMLAISWNASVWALTFAAMARRWSLSGGPPLGEAVLRVMAACTPHMAAEGVAYVTAGLAGVFLSRGVMRHGIDSPVLHSILLSVMWMMLGALGLVVLAAAWEANVAGLLVNLLS